MSFTRLIASIAALAFAQSAAAATIWDEGVNGDLSGNRLAPTLLTLAVGTNTIIGSTTAGDLDYFTFSVPAGASFTQLILSAYGAPDLAFLAIQNGSIITEPPGAPNAANLLGYVHVGPGLVGTDILDNMGASNLLAPPAQGFAPPLGPGPYAFWQQQFNVSATNYTYDVIVVPEPSVAVLVALGLGGLAIARRRPS